MSSSTIEQTRTLSDRIGQTQEELGGLEHNLRAIDREMATLAAQRDRYQLLDDACRSLDKLRELGSEELFWGTQSPAGESARRIHDARLRVESFHAELAHVEQRRESILLGIREGQEVLDILEDDLLEVQEQEELRKAEWLVDRELDDTDLLGRPQVMPWTRGGDDDRRFRKALAACLLLGVLLGSIIPLIDIPFPERNDELDVPERFAKLIRQEQPPEPLPPAVVEPVVQEQPEPEIEPEVVEEAAPVVANVPDKPEVQEAPAPAAPPQEAPPEPAKATGILAFRESFASLADNRPSARLGAQARINNAGEAAVGRSERSMVTAEGPGSSGGINIGSLSRDVGGGGGDGEPIAGVAVTRVASAIQGAGNGNSDRPLAGGAVAGRTDEEIQIVFDRYKAALYRLYNRELRNDPTLRGQMVLRLTIEPNGSVSFCAIQTSDMHAPTLEQQVAERVRTFDFGAKDVPAVTILYPIDFLPAG
jgi:hypothetical protein